jgi:hypothetical protein
MSAGTPHSDQSQQEYDHNTCAISPELEETYAEDVTMIE